tara:strand:+ start:1581 stop:1961 length:381 start_codon:yes stop_codon:yes gene_type:complete
MTNFSSTITFSKDNFDSPSNIIHKIEYKHTTFSGDNLWVTYYNNKIDNNGIVETFNKLHKNGDDVYEKIGNSQNKNSWDIKEFLNTIVKKQYVDNYQDNNFNQNLLDAIYDNIKYDYDNDNKILLK